MTDQTPEARMTDKMLSAIVRQADKELDCDISLDEYSQQVARRIADAAGLLGYRAMEQVVQELLEISHDLANRADSARDYLQFHYGGTWGELDTGKFRKALAAYRLQHRSLYCTGHE